MLTDADLSQANLSNADLSEALLYSTNLLQANLSGANLSGVDLRMVGFITPEQIATAIIDNTTTILPEGITLELIEQIRLGQRNHKVEEQHRRELTLTPEIKKGV